MILMPWDCLPAELRNSEVKEYYDILKRKNPSLAAKRSFDILMSAIALILLSPVFLVICIAVKADSKGPVLFRQERVTQYGRRFRMYKFRTMEANTELQGMLTAKDDGRITKSGKLLRKYRLDELPQLLNIIKGDMSFVGTRPEVSKYVDRYTNEMKATLLLPAGMTSAASIFFNNESKYLDNKYDIDKIYIEDILPRKMRYNLEGIKSLSFFGDIKILVKTVLAVTGVKKWLEAPEETIIAR